jgi:hypothetical protein
VTERRFGVVVVLGATVGRGLAPAGCLGRVGLGRRTEVIGLVELIESA